MVSRAVFVNQMDSLRWNRDPLRRYSLLKFCAVIPISSQEVAVALASGTFPTHGAKSVANGDSPLNPRGHADRW